MNSMDVNAYGAMKWRCAACFLSSVKDSLIARTPSAWTVSKVGNIIIKTQKCFVVAVTTPQQGTDAGENFTMTTMFFILAVILYFIRPSTVMRSFNDSKKPHEPSTGGQGPDRGAPPATN